MIAKPTYTDGTNLARADAEKTNFTTELTSRLTDAWQDKHTLQTVTPTILSPALPTVRVGPVPTPREWKML